MAEDTVNYRGKSIFVSKTMMIFNVLSAIATILGASEIKSALGPQALVYVTTALAVINVILRAFTVRPVAMTMPGRSKPVAVPKLAA
jgi:hypothetical protein